MAFNFANLRSQTAIDESGGPSNHDLYVSQANNPAVDKFALNSLTHTYEYVCQLTGLGKGCVAEGTEPAWQNPWGVAVDGAGNVYVSGAGPGFGSVSEFTSSGGDVGTVVPSVFPGEHVRTPAGLAVASDGTLYVNSFYRNLVELIPGGAELLLEEKGSGEEQKPTAVAVDASGNLFVDESSRITEYTPAGVQIAQFGDREPGESIGGGTCFGGQCSEGVAVYNATKDVYVTDRETGSVKVFEPVVIPDATTGGAENLHKTTATVAGSVNPAGPGETHYYFQYGPTAEYGLTSTETGAPASTPVQAELSSLAPQTEYHYRLVAFNENGVKSYGKDMTFTTSAVVTFKYCPPTTLHAIDATLCVTIDPEGFETFYRFDYGPTTEYGLFAPLESGELTNVGSGARGQFEAPIGGLLPSRTYHYNVIAFNEFGFTLGPDETLTTPPADPTVNDQPPFAAGIAPHEATLHGTINPGEGVTTYHFVYGPTSAYGSSSPDAYTQLNYEDDPVQQTVTGLKTGTVYHYALVASNPSATTTGPDQQFTTPPEPPAVAPEPSPSGPSLEVTSIPGITQPATAPSIAFPSIAFPAEPSPPPAGKRLTNAQRLAKALKACNRKPSAQRVRCKKQARKKYGAKGHRAMT